jgi:hypothetical protein
MGLLKKIASRFLGGEGGDSGDVHWEYVRCSRCGEKIAVRVDLRNELTPQWDEGEGAYYTHKGVVGSGETRCFQMIELDLYFNADRRLLSRYVSGGEFITRDEYEAREAPSDSPV